MVATVLHQITNKTTLSRQHAYVLAVEGCAVIYIYFIGCRHYYGTVAGKVAVFVFVTKRCHIGSVEVKLHLV
jgi:hypothetical protein